VCVLSDDVGDWLRVAFETKMGVFQSTGMFLNRILDKELVSLTVKETHECKRCSYKCLLPYPLVSCGIVLFIIVVCAFV
jgi:hypothetical protein